MFLSSSFCSPFQLLASKDGFPFNFFHIKRDLQSGQCQQHPRAHPEEQPRLSLTGPTS